MSKTTLSSIPTLSQLFKNGSIKNNPTGKAFKEASRVFKEASRVSLWQGDITTLEIDGIVNAANESLLGGGGVDGAIHRAAGPELLKECKTLKGCDTGDAKITKGHNLPSKHVIHTVGPIYSNTDPEKSEEELRSAYRRSLEEATKAGLKSVAFPSISTGVYRFPIPRASELAAETVGAFLASSDGSHLERVIFCVHGDKDLEIYQKTLGETFEG